MDELFVSEEKRKAAQQKFARWKEQKQIEEFNEIGKQQMFDKFSDKIVNRLNNPVNQQIESSLASEMSETNYCCICLEMMLPPYKPMMLVPCGHNVCEMCLKSHSSTLTKCPTCKGRIETYSPNYSLMSLISRFKESQIKINKQNAELQQKVNSVMGDVEILRLRCSILEKEKKELQANLVTENRNVQVLETVQKKLMEEKRRVKKQLETLQEEQELLNRHLAETDHKLKLARVVAESTHEKYVLLENSLAPMLLQKEKAELLEMEKLVNGSK